MAETAEAVAATGGLRVIPDVTLDACPPLDVLVVPGGWGTRSEIKNERLLAWIRERGAAVETLTSVCTGSMLLGQAGLLDGRHATTHWRSLPSMRDAFPAVTVEEKLHVVEDGHVLTSAGISAGIDMALRVVARFRRRGRAARRAPHGIPLRAGGQQPPDLVRGGRLALDAREARLAEGRHPMVYRGMDRAALDAAYNNTAAVGVAKREEYVADWMKRSEKIRKAPGAQIDLRYGDGARHRLDVFPCERSVRPRRSSTSTADTGR